MKNLSFSEDGVSEIVGALMLISVVVVVVAIMGVYLFSQPPTQKIPSLQASIWNDTQTLSISHDGGDPISYNEIKIYVNCVDQTSKFNLSTAPTQPWTTWTNGNVLQYSTHSFPLGNVMVAYKGTSSDVALTTFFVGDAASACESGVFVPPPPVANFIGFPTAGWPPPLSVSFTDTSTGSPASWSWNFGDIGPGNTSTQQSLSHTYAKGGIYSVNLTVINTVGTNTLIKTNYITITPNPLWYSCSWGNRKNITIDKSRVSGTLSDFPVLINLASDADLASYAQSNGNDILFTSSDGTTKLSHEIETYTSSNGALVAWVKVPSVQSSADTTIYMYYGNSGAANQQSPASVWGTNFKAVWHLKEDPSGTAPQMLDSTSNANHGTSAGAMTTSDQVAARINGGLDFDGSNDYLGTNYVQTGVTAYTIEVWIKTSTTSVQRVIVHNRGSGAGRSLTLEVGGTYPGGPGGAGNVGYGVDSDSIYIGRYSTSTVNDNNWHHVVGVWTALSGTAIDPAQFSIYIDGNAAATNNAATGSATSPLTGLGGTQLAYHQPWGTYLPGIIDEVRISTSPLSADWIKTEYNNQNSPSTFHYFGNQEQWTC